MNDSISTEVLTVWRVQEVVGALNLVLRGEPVYFATPRLAKAYVREQLSERAGASFQIFRTVVGASEVEVCS
jgi:hypothetical protein